MRKTPASPKPVFHTPTQMNWTDEKLASLSEAELLSLLSNLATQRSSGRVADTVADELTVRIHARLPTRVVNQLRKRAKLAAEAAGADQASG
ncbi:MAG: hypothetical protein MUC68_14380 [Burkholderiaceae bacterium]|jgi:hypothetical protein|nr:hypothetical protein [Burkholderiaceae bacterium]